MRHKRVRDRLKSDPRREQHARDAGGSPAGQFADPGLPDAQALHDINPVGVGFALAGSLALVIGVFLPQLESSVFTSGIAENSLIQEGGGYIFIGLAAGIAAATYRSWKTGKRSWAVPILGLLAMAGAYFYGTNEVARELYSLDEAGDPVGDAIVASPAVGIYVVGVGGLLAIIGAYQMIGHSAPRDVGPVTPAAMQKQCPDCAETVLAEARICKYCGYRFDRVT